MSRILTLTTDFGTRDAYVASMKGVILGINPAVTLVDITHDLTPHDIMEAAFVISSAIPCFPPGTVHLVVVDPGVGTARRPVALRGGDQLFVGPDNGLFSLILNGKDPEEMVTLDQFRYWRTEEISNTFHGRDIFAPVAAHLSGGCPLTELGSPQTSLEPLHWALPIADDQGIRGWVVHIDRFGNCITNITSDLYESFCSGRSSKCYVGSTILGSLAKTYGQVSRGEPVLVEGSTGFLEIAVNMGNASDLLGIRKGAAVNIVFQERRP